MIKRLFSGIINFAKQKPALFVIILLVIIVILFYATYEALHLTSASSFCGVCHQEAQAGPGGEYYTWEKNVHAYAGVGCIDCHGKPGFFGYMRAKMGGVYDLYSQIVHSKEHKMNILIAGATDKQYAKELFPNDWCLFCHSDSVNKATQESTMMSFLGLRMRAMDKVNNPDFRKHFGLADLFTEPVKGVDPNHKTHVQTLGLSCIDCHMGVAHAGELHNRTKMDTCFTCHDLERPKKDGQKMPANDDCAVCHKTVVDIQKGEFLKNKGIEKTVAWEGMADVFEDCASCHADATTRPTKQVCVDCHEGLEEGTGEGMGDMVKDIQDEFAGQKAELDKAWMDLFKTLKDMDSARAAKFADFNTLYNLIETDGSKGVHNSEFMNAVFEKAKALAAELNGKKEASK